MHPRRFRLYVPPDAIGLALYAGEELSEPIPSERVDGHQALRSQRFDETLKVRDEGVPAGVVDLERDAVTVEER